MDKIELKNISCSFNTEKGKFTALKNISLTWNEGESIAFIGESGSGKSTLAKIILGMIKASGGTISLNGENMANWKYSKWKKVRTNLQGVFQDSSGTLNPARNTYHNMEEALKNLTELNKNARYERILSLLPLFNLNETILNVPVTKLSGGEGRRIGLLRAISVRPKFLVLDEITAGLDLISVNAVLKVLSEYQKEFNCCYFIITHDIEVAKRLCSHIYELKNGEIVHEYKSIS